MSQGFNIDEHSRNSFKTWGPHWRAEVLAERPMIAPARQFVYPMQIAGEEDAVARGALQLLVHPPVGGTFLATCALGFTSVAMATGIFACPNPDELCAIAGGYAYIVDTADPERCTHLPLKPVVEVLASPSQSVLVFAGFHKMMAWGVDGLAWETARLSWEGMRLGKLEGDTLHGFGWNMQTDADVAFTVNLLDGSHTGGGF